MIPRVFHQIWVGGPLPELYAEWAERWREMHPGWEYVLWTEESIPGEDWALSGLIDRAPEIAPDHVGQCVSDLARLEILLRCGGVYIDTDQEPLKPIDDLLEGVTAFAGWEVEPGRTSHGWIANGVMGCTPGHPWIEDLIAHLPANVDRMARKGVRRPNRISGPKYLTRLTRNRADVKVFPRNTFYPYGWAELDRYGETFPHSYAVHHWNNMRRERGVPL